MFFQLVFLLSLSWTHGTGTENADKLDGVGLDQIATASEIVAQSTKQLRERQKHFQDQLIPSMIDTTIHFENSNGFVPMIPSSLPDDRDLFYQPSATPLSSHANESNSKDPTGERSNQTEITNRVSNTEKKDGEKVEDDLAYSTEARIFLNLPQSGTNRRSFDFQDGQNDFELLKVKNDTPEVANYQDFYENVQSTVTNGNDRGQDDQSSLKRKNREREKRIESPVNNHASFAQTNEDPPHNRYHSYSTDKNTKKIAYEQEKVTGNYLQQESTSYNGHGQSTTRQTSLIDSSLPRTSQQEVNEPARSGSQNFDKNYDNVATSSTVTKMRHRFSRPVVVAEPSNYKPNFNIGGQSQSRFTDTRYDDYPTSRIVDSSSSETSDRYTIYNREGRFRSYDRGEDSRDVSDDGPDYLDYTERPRRVQKGKRRPYGSESSKRFPKEHRGSLDDSLELEDTGKRQNLHKLKSHRQRVKANSWTDEDRKRGHDDSYEESRYDDRVTGSETNHKNKNAQQNTKFKPSNAWNQISPNIEISHSSGIELDQIEKPKFIVPYKLNILPVGNFDHATALGNSQGFDVSNAVLQNFVTAAPINAVSASTTLLSTPDTMLSQNAELPSVPKNLANLQNIGISSPVPEIIVGQNTFQNPMHTVLFPQANGQNKFSTNLRAQYMPSTVAPVFAVTPALNPSLQSVPVENIPSTVTPRPTYVATPSSTSSIQHVSTNQIHQGLPHLIVPQPTLQTLSNFMQAPVQHSSEYNIQVNPRGLHGQNVVNQPNFQMHDIQSVSTVSPTQQVLPVTKINLVSAETQNKKNALPGSSANFLASASLAVGQNDQKQAVNGNSYYVQNQNPQQMDKTQMQEHLYQVLKNVHLTPKTKTFIQTAQVVPAILHPMPTISTIGVTNQQFMPEQSAQSTNFVLQRPRDQNQQFVIQNNGVANAMQQLQFQIQKEQMLKNTKLYEMPGVSGMAENAHLPNVVMKNVEILNPNLKTSPIDATIVNSYEAMHYPAAVLTTPIPMFSTTSFITARPATVSTTTSGTMTLQNYVDSLTEIGSKGHQAQDLKTEQNQERPMFNPINFVPNMDVVKNQNDLNSKLHASEPLQQNLNLVPLIPGGNFFKPSFSAQSELMVKPKLTTDLEKYAEQMFKESLKTIYNSQKWNNDRKPHHGRRNVSDSIDLSKLKSELQKLQASMSESNHNKNTFGSHHTNGKFKINESHRDASSTNDHKKPDQLLAALEQVLKTHPTESVHVQHGHRPGYKHRPHEQGDSKHPRDFLTPPKPLPHRSKGSFNEKPGKKRPGSGPPRFSTHSHYSGPRPHLRPSSLSPKSAALEASASNINLGIREGPRFESTPHGIPYDRVNDFESRHRTYPNLQKGSSPFDSFQSFSSSSPENTLNKMIKSQKDSNGKEYDINHPRMHNLLGLLMKNKQLPAGNSQSYFRDKDQLKQFFESEKQRMQQQFYDDTLRDYFLKTSDGTSYSALRSNVTSGRRVLSEKGAA